jgi:hypothetical protein
MTGRFSVGEKMSPRPNAMPVAIPPMADRLRQPSNLLGGSRSGSSSFGVPSDGAPELFGSMAHDLSVQAKREGANLTDLSGGRNRTAL